MRRIMLFVPEEVDEISFDIKWPIKDGKEDPQERGESKHTIPVARNCFSVYDGKKRSDGDE